MAHQRITNLKNLILQGNAGNSVVLVQTKETNEQSQSYELACGNSTAREHKIYHEGECYYRHNLKQRAQF